MQAGAISTLPNAGIPQAARRRPAADADPRAAGVMFEDPNGNVLLLKRGESSDFPGHWCFPAGGIEEGETPEAAARRESAEETGVEPGEELPLLNRAPMASGGGEFHTFKHNVQERFEPKLDGEHTDHAWASPDDLPLPLHPGVAQLFAARGKDVGAADSEGWRMLEAALAIDDAPWEESKHPRGEGGKFGSGGGGGHGAREDDGQKERAAANEFLKSKLSPEDYEKFLGMAGGQEHKAAGAEARRSHAQRVKQFMSNPKSVRVVGGWVKKHGMGIAHHQFNHSVVVPAVHTAIGAAMHHLGATSGEAMAAGVAAYTVHQLMHKADIGPHTAIKLFKGAAKALLDAHKAGEMKAEHGSEVGGRDAAPQDQDDDISASLERLLAVIDEVTPEMLAKAAKAKPPAEDSKEPEHRAEIEFDGDFNLAGLLRALWWLGQAGALRTVEVAGDDPETQRQFPDDGKCKFSFDGDGADKIRSATIDGEDVIRNSYLAEDSRPRTLYAKRNLLNGGALVDWASGLGLKALPADEMHVTVAFSEEPLEWPAPGADHLQVAGGRREVKLLGDQGAVVLSFESPELHERWKEFRDAGAAWQHEGYTPHVTFTMADPANPPDVSELEPYDGLLEFGPEVFDETGNCGKAWAEKARRAIAGDAAEPKIDRDHGVKWLSVMSRDGDTVYIHDGLEREITLPGTEEKSVTFDPADPLAAHEVRERRKMRELLAAFIPKHGREPNDEEREAIYMLAHDVAGTPADDAWCDEHGVDKRAWQAWCRGKLAKLENTDPPNPPPDPDVKPFRHVHGALEFAGDQALRGAAHMALDRARSVRDTDRDGKLRITKTHLSKANVCPYRGREIPEWQTLGLEPERIYFLWRHPDELRKAASSSNLVQVLSRHVAVNADDHQPWETVGSTGTDGEFNDPYLDNSLVIWARDAIDGVESGEQQQISMGYHYRCDLTPGETPDGEKFDGVMREIAVNHIALVEAGRAGPDVVVADSLDNILWGEIADSLITFWNDHA